VPGGAWQGVERIVAKFDFASTADDVLAGQELSGKNRNPNRGFIEMKGAIAEAVAN
jgi:hypothetical protein